MVGGAAGQIIDVVGDLLAPIGLGGLWTGVAGKNKYIVNGPTNHSP